MTPDLSPAAITAPAPPPPDLPAPPPARPGRPRWLRARFRARLDRDPRPWVLFLAATEGLLAFAWRVQEKRGTFYEGFPAALAVMLAFAALAPAGGVLGLLVHGRLVYRTGRAVGGRGRPAEIYAALAWSELPFVLVAWPLALELPLRVAAAELDVLPAWLRFAVDRFGTIAAPIWNFSAIAALAGALVSVPLLAEAQRFSAWRALANQLLAGLLGLALLVAGALVTAWLLPGARPAPAVIAGLAVIAALASAGELLAARAERRRNG